MRLSEAYLNQSVATISPANPSDCALELIQFPGSIQPHGAVMVISEDAVNTVTHVSANIGDFLGGVTPNEMLGRSFASVVGDIAAAALCEPLTDRVQSWQMPGAAALGEGRLYLQSHRAGPRIVVDIEALYPDAWRLSNLTQMQWVLKSFENAHSQLELCELAVRGLREVTGYDRIMAYRFGQEGHGEVVAEACAAHLDPYLGQHYPASDIPIQARQLYLSHPVGVIADSDYVPVPLIGDVELDTGGPVDLTGSSLRSVSPVHREFMRNMRTSASMTIGLVQDSPGGRELWGMLVCHHATPRAVSPELREVAHVLGRVVSLLLASLQTKQVSAEKLRRYDSLRTLTVCLADGAPLLETMSDMCVELLRLTDSSGALVRFNGQQICLGSAPDGALATMIRELLKPELGTQLRAVDDLCLRYAQMASCTRQYSGALMLSLADDTDDCIVWFRPEQEQTIVWGGNPRKPVVTDPHTGVISPRASFQAWKEVVHARSLPWSNAVFEIALELRQVIARDVLRRANISAKLELESVNSRLNYTIHELDQFVYVASHDLRAPLRAISSLAEFVLQDDLHLGELTTERLTLIKSRALRMQNMLNDILAYARAGEGYLPGASAIPLDQVVREVVMTLSPSAGFAIRLGPPNNSLLAIPVFSVPLSQVLLNCIGNAIKHHDRSVGSVDVGVADCGDHWRFSVTDDGPGIPEAYRESVFEMFATLKSRDQVEGSGMGLALVRKIVRRMGGACGIAPRSGRGTCVWFDWPKVPEVGVNDL